MTTLKTSLDMVLQTHEKAIASPILRYEYGLKDAARAFTHFRTEAEADYPETLKQQTPEIHRHPDDAGITGNNRIDTWHLRMTHR